MITRRTLLASGALLGALGVYSSQRGLRYPRLSFEHTALKQEFETPNYIAQFVDCIATEANSLRAIAPEPKVTLQLLSENSTLQVRNVAPNAQLSIDAPAKAVIDEQISGLDRQISINAKTNDLINLTWSLPVSDGFEFAVMGDTGGGSELSWTLTRAHQLGAQFLLHLGDFNYSEGEYHLAMKQFDSASLPCYVTIGNHDFHDNGLIYDDFLSRIGPMNHAFELAGTRFINVDTAADFWPANSGQRGKLFKQLNTAKPFEGEQILFTHRPLKDPRPHDEHEVGGIGEIAYLSDQCHALGISNFLHGHVHHSAELDFNGLRQFSIGEGLGHENLVLQKPVAKMLMGKVEPNQELDYRWVDLQMPWAAHQSPTHLKKLKRDNRHRQLDWYLAMLHA